jgi:carbonic anhydrase
MFGLQLTDGAIIFRNVGGHVTHCIPDILALDGFLRIDDILIVHHTDCGTTHFKNIAIRAGLKERLPEQSEEIDGMDFGSIEK